MILDATTILLNIYISLIGLFHFWFSLVLLLISGWGPWLMFHHGDWGGGGGSFWSSSIWMDRKFFRHSYSSGIFFSRLLRMILGFIPISLTQETKPFRNLILSLEGILSCTIIPRLRNGIMFCFHHGRRSVFAIGMMKNMKHHTLQRLHWFFYPHVKFTCACFIEIELCIWLLLHVPLLWSFTHPQAFTLPVKALAEISSGIWKAPYLSMKQGSLFVFVLFYLVTLTSFKSHGFIPSTPCRALGIFKKALNE